MEQNRIKHYIILSDETDSSSKGKVPKLPCTMFTVNAFIHTIVFPEWTGRLGGASNVIDVAKFIITQEFIWTKYCAGLTVILSYMTK